jgi:hypothetical protein
MAKLDKAKKTTASKIIIPKVKEIDKLPKTPKTEVDLSAEISDVIGKADITTYAKENDIDRLSAHRVALRAKLNALKLTALKKPTWQQRCELKEKTSRLYQHITWVSHRIVDIKRVKQKAAQKGVISKVAAKQAKIVALVRAGKSLSVIINHPDGVDKSELKALLTPQIVLECAKHRSDFESYWNRWQEKYLS